MEDLGEFVRTFITHTGDFLCGHRQVPDVLNGIKGVVWIVVRGEVREFARFGLAVCAVLNLPQEPKEGTCSSFLLSLSRCGATREREIEA